MNLRTTPFALALLAIVATGCVQEPLDQQWYEGGPKSVITLKAYGPISGMDITTNAKNFRTGQWEWISDNAMTWTKPTATSDGLDWYLAQSPATGLVSWPQHGEVPGTDRVRYLHPGLWEDVGGGILHAQLRVEVPTNNQYPFEYRSAATFRGDAEFIKCANLWVGSALSIHDNCSRPGQGWSDIANLYTCKTPPCKKPVGWRPPY